MKEKIYAAGTVLLHHLAIVPFLFIHQDDPLVTRYTWSRRVRARSRIIKKRLAWPNLHKAYYFVACSYVEMTRQSLSTFRYEQAVIYAAKIPGYFVGLPGEKLLLRARIESLDAGQAFKWIKEYDYYFTREECMEIIINVFKREGPEQYATLLKVNDLPEPRLIVKQLFDDLEQQGRLQEAYRFMVAVQAFNPTLASNTDYFVRCVKEVIPHAADFFNHVVKRDPDAALKSLCAILAFVDPGHRNRAACSFPLRNFLKAYFKLQKVKFPRLSTFCWTRYSYSFDRGRYGDAYLWLQIQALFGYPSAHRLYYMALCQYYMDDYDLLYEILDAGGEKGRSEFSEYLLALVNFDQHNYKDALAHARLATSLSKDDYYIHFMKAKIYVQQAEFEKALDHISYTLKEGERSYVLIKRAEIYRGMNRYQEALADLKQALEIDPFSFTAHQELADILNVLGQKKQANLHQHFAETMSLEEIADVKDEIKCMVKRAEEGKG